jgi:hypothetical protein
VNFPTDLGGFLVGGIGLVVSLISIHRWKQLCGYEFDFKRRNVLSFEEVTSRTHYCPV